jgi:hypothetical protein
MTMLLGDVVKGDKQITQGEDGLEDIWVKKDKRNRTIPRGHIQPWTQVHPTTELSGGETKGPYRVRVQGESHLRIIWCFILETSSSCTSVI